MAVSPLDAHTVYLTLYVNSAADCPSNRVQPPGEGGASYVLCWLQYRSTDGGAHWARAELGLDQGKYAFRSWTASFAPALRQQYSLQSLAVNNVSETQRMMSAWNSSGYLRNSIETVQVDAA